MTPLALTVKQPWASLIVAGVKDVENRGWPVPSTLPQWVRCARCDGRIAPGTRWVASRQCGPGERHCGSLVPDGPFPFRLWVHAGASIDNTAWRSPLVREHMPRPTGCGARHWFTDYGAPGSRRKSCARCRWEPPSTGALLGSVTVTGCHGWVNCLMGTAPQGAAGCSPWGDDEAFHWKLRDPQPLDKPIAIRGRQKLWRLPDHLTRTLGVPAA